MATKPKINNISNPIELWGPIEIECAYKTNWQKIKILAIELIFSDSSSFEILELLVIEYPIAPEITTQAAVWKCTPGLTKSDERRLSNISASSTTSPVAAHNTKGKSAIIVLSLPSIPSLRNQAESDRTKAPSTIAYVAVLTLL